MKVELSIKNFPAQQSIFDSKARYKVASKGRRFGLTKGAANDFIRAALQRDFKQGLWVDTVNVNIDRYVERYFLPNLRKLPDNLYKWSKQSKVLYILDSYIDFRSVDRPENIEGFGYDKAFLNEAGIILKNDYLWNNAIRPMLWEFKPTTVIGGTPKGKGTFFELYQRGLDPEQRLYEAFHFTSFDNPYLDAKMLEEEIKSLPEMARKQEIYAEFLDDSGVVFRGLKQVMNATPEKPKSGHIYVVGVDLAKQEDFTVISVYDRSTNKQVYQDRFNQIDWPFQKHKIKSVSRHYNNALVYLDATGLGDPIADDLSREGVPVEPITLTNTSKKEMIEKLVIWIEQQTIAILNLEETYNEFSNYTYDISSTGKIRYNAPTGFHDDIVISHALAVQGLFPIAESEKIEEKTPLQEYYEQIKRPKAPNDVEYFEV